MESGTFEMRSLEGGKWVGQMWRILARRVATIYDQDM
jgi:hypothetical protein